MPFLRSDIGRLVYGFLLTECNDDIAQEFLNKYEPLMECRRQKELGYSFCTKVQNLLLTEVLNRFLNLLSIFERTSPNETNPHNLPTLVQNLLKSKLGSLVEYHQNRASVEDVSNLSCASNLNIRPPRECCTSVKNTGVQCESVTLIKATHEKIVCNASTITEPENITGPEDHNLVVNDLSPNVSTSHCTPIQKIENCLPDTTETKLQTPINVRLTPKSKAKCITSLSGSRNKVVRSACKTPEGKFQINASVEALNNKYDSSLNQLSRTPSSKVNNEVSIPSHTYSTPIVDASKEKTTNLVNESPRVAPKLSSSVVSVQKSEDEAKNSSESLMIVLPEKLASKSLPWDYSLRQAIADNLIEINTSKDKSENGKSKVAIKRKREIKTDAKSKIVNDAQNSVVCKKQKKLEEARKVAVTKKQRKSSQIAEIASTKKNRLDSAESNSNPYLNSDLNEIEMGAAANKQKGSVQTPDIAATRKVDLASTETNNHSSLDSDAEVFDVELVISDLMIIYSKEGIPCTIK